MPEPAFPLRPLRELVAACLGGGTPSRAVSSYWRGNIPWASVKDFPDSVQVIHGTQEHISRAGLESSTSNMIPAGTPLVCTRMAVGRAAIPAIAVAINQDVRALYPAPGVPPEYLLRLMKYAERAADSQAVGSTVKGVRVEDYLNIRVPVAPPEDQALIADLIRDVDGLVQLEEQAVIKLRQSREGLLHDLLTRGVSENGERRPDNREAPHLYKPSPIGRLPADWEIFPLQALAASLIDGPFGSNLKTSHYVSQPGVRVVRLQNIGTGAYDDSDRAFVSADYARKLDRHRVMPGDLLVASLGDDNHPVGRACCYPPGLPDAINKADCFRFRANNLCRNDFIMHSLNQERARRQVRGFEQGVTMKRMNLGNLRRVQLAVPPLPEQDRICDRLATAENMIAVQQERLEKLKLLRAGLADDLLTGRIRVTPLFAAAAEPELEGVG